MAGEKLPSTAVLIRTARSRPAALRARVNPSMAFRCACVALTLNLFRRLIPLTPVPSVGRSRLMMAFPHLVVGASSALGLALGAYILAFGVMTILSPVFVVTTGPVGLVILLSTTSFSARCSREPWVSHAPVLGSNVAVPAAKASTVSSAASLPVPLSRNSCTGATILLASSLATGTVGSVVAVGSTVSTVSVGSLVSALMTMEASSRLSSPVP